MQAIVAGFSDRDTRKEQFHNQGPSVGCVWLNVLTWPSSTWQVVTAASFKTQEATEY